MNLCNNYVILCAVLHAAIMDQFSVTVQVACEVGIDLVYGISPAGSICYSSPADFNRLCARLESFYTIGVRAFSLLLDGLIVNHIENDQRKRLALEWQSAVS